MKISDGSSSRVTRVSTPVARPATNTARPAVGHSLKSSFTAAPAAVPTGGDPNAQALLGLKRGATGTNVGIKQLQDDLVRMGYLDKSITSNSGYGNTFGPMTQAGVKKLQADKGLPVTGVVDQATVDALGPQVPPAPLVPGTTYPGAPAGDPAAAALVGLQKGTGTPAQVKQLQDDLLRMGYVGESFAKNGGYGKQFGPLTEGAVKQFQKDNGLPQTGVVDTNTATALAYPRPRPAGFAAGPAITQRAELGLPIGPAQTQADGSLRQNFDKGYVQVTEDGRLFVRNNANLDIVPPREVGTSSSIAQANESFVSQWGPTEWNSAQGAPMGYKDCGPTSALMALNALGLVPHPLPGDAEKAIDAIRDQAIGYDTSQSQLTGDGQMIRALEANGATTAQVRPLNAESMDAALAAGHPVMVGSSTTWSAWGQAQNAAGDYLNHGNPGGHYITVLGKAPNGNYIVADPLSKTGSIEVTSDQMTKLYAGAWGGIEVSRP
ncbi:MAG: peptidoglycan-binding protein [Myxococcaceae bacterium]